MKTELSSEGRIDQPQNSAFPMVQPMKAALYFDDIDGFGEWSVLLSTRTQKDMREIRRKDGTMFRIIMQKMKWDLALNHDDDC